MQAFLSMDKQTETYLKYAYDLLGKEYGISREAFLRQFREEEGNAVTETDLHGYVYLLYACDITPESEHLTELVFDSDRAVADVHALHTLGKQDILNEAEDDPWLQAERELLDDFPEAGGDILFVQSAYVTRRYRKQGIFTGMVQAMRDFGSRKRTEDYDSWMLWSLDPDVACYGEDAVSEPYIYTRAKDDPIRDRNLAIAQKAGMMTVDDRYRITDPEDDGCFLTFAVDHKQIHFVNESDETA